MTAKPASRTEAAQLERRIIEYAKIGLPVAVVLCATLAGVVLGASATILVLAGGALVAVIAIFWASLRTVLGETPLTGADAYALGAPRAEEEQKQAVLRALKDLEFERSVGKISDEDYQDLVAKYRAEAKRLLRILDEDAQPRRQQVEALVTQHLRRVGLADAGAGAEEDEDAAPKEDAAPAKGRLKRLAKRPAPARSEAARSETGDDAPAAERAEEAAPEEAPEPEAEPKAEKKVGAAARECAACGTMNDADAIFCKRCGARQGGPEEDDDDDDDADEGESARERGAS